MHLCDNRYNIVFDLGKTNKKILLFENDEVISIEKKEFPEQIRNGIIFEPIYEISEWFMALIKKIVQKYKVETITISSHGGTFVCVDEYGEIVAPVLSYLNEPHSSVLQQFNSLAGDFYSLYKKTCTPRMEKSVNLALGFMNACYLFPSIMEASNAVLCLPQYFVMLLSGEKLTELTYLGCHTYLWDFERWDWSDIAREIGYKKLSPSVIKSKKREILVSDLNKKKFDIDYNIEVLPGIHDSNASLIPYLLQYGSKFFLHSTGSWCVTMLPSKNSLISENEMNNNIFYNINVLNEPVKTHSFPGGIILSKHMDLLKKINPDFVRQSEDIELLKKQIQQKDLFFIPHTLNGEEYFIYKNKKLSVDEYMLLKKDESLKNLVYGEYYSAIVTGLVLSVCNALKDTNLSEIEYIFVEGGFEKNIFYLTFMAALFHEKTLAVSNITEGTAFGSHLYKSILNNKSKSENSSDQFKTVSIDPNFLKHEEVIMYRDKWDELVSNSGNI